MARSLEIEIEKIEFDIDGKVKEGNVDNIMVTVDGDNTNASFTVSVFNDYWFKYSVVRKSGVVYVVVKANKNLSTQERYGSLTIRHNCVNLSKEIEITQDAVEYEIENTNNVHYHSFMSCPRYSEKGDYCHYEEFTLPFKAISGRERWYVKSVEQYQVSLLDNFTDEEYVGKLEQEDSMAQSATPYDNVFDYTIKDNALIVRSYGQIDLTNAIRKTEDTQNPHMRYFFTICHSDVNNDNKRWMDDKEIYSEDKGTKKYEDRVLFVFDNNYGSGYGEDDNTAIDPITPPSETTQYVFTVNGSSKPQIFNFTFDAKTTELNIVSTVSNKGETKELGYTVDGKNEWCKLENGQLIIEANDGFSNRSNVLTLTQMESNNVIKLTIAQESAFKAYVFTLNGGVENIEAEIETESDAYTIVSTYGSKDTPYTITNISSTKWMSYKANGNTYTFEADKNPSHEERRTNYAFKQTNSNKVLYLTLIQKGAEDVNEFTAYFKDDGSSSKTIGGDMATIEIVVVSTKNGSDEPYTYSAQYYDSATNTWLEDGNGWLSYSDSAKSIKVSQYSYNDERKYNDGESKDLSTTARIVFSREGLSDQVITLTQKRSAQTDKLYTDDTITVGWESGYYGESIAKVYSYGTEGGTMKPIAITGTSISSGDFITNAKVGAQKQDSDGYYYEITVSVKTNETESVKTGSVKVTNASGMSIDVPVEQRKNGEVVLTAFDYIVMNYYWTDYTDSSGTIYSRDFDCVMYFDTPAIGTMNQKCAYFLGKLIKDKDSQGNDCTYGELAYDQLTSNSIKGTNRIETQVVYLLKLQQDGYLQKIKEASQKYLTIQLYGNLYNVDGANATPANLRTTRLSIHTYLGGTMQKDDTNQTMKNVGGTEVNVGAINDVSYNISAINKKGGSSVSVVTSLFQHLGKLEYNVRDKSAVFIPAN